MIYRITMLGPQGCGKGTQAELLSKAFAIPQVQPGVIYRKEVAMGTPLGKQIAPILTSGAMVPHEITNAIVLKRLHESDCAGGFILDGFPRAMPQVEALDASGLPLTHAILLDITDDEAVRRLTQRLVCLCGKPFTGKEFPVEEGQEKNCTACNGKLMRRTDDTADAIRQRLAFYHAETARVVAEYDRRGILVRIDGMRAIHDVHQEILTKLNPSA